MRPPSLVPLVGVVASGLLFSGCIAEVPLGQRASTSDATVTLHDHALALHLSITPQRPLAPLVIYATGDAGWYGDDREIFTEIARWGYPAVGFSAREYVHHIGAHVTTLPPADVAYDYGAIADAAEAALHLTASTPVLLVGKSRGADLAVVVASEPSFQSRLAGVIAVGLTREEEYVAIEGAPGVTPVMFQTYDSMPRIGPIPVAVVQSTHDDYVPADQARMLLGPDTASRTLRPVASGDHNFSGAVEEMYEEMSECLSWILNR